VLALVAPQVAEEFEALSIISLDVDDNERVGATAASRSACSSASASSRQTHGRGRERGSFESRHTAVFLSEGRGEWRAHVKSPSGRSGRRTLGVDSADSETPARRPPAHDASPSPRLPAMRSMLALVNQTRCSSKPCGRIESSDRALEQSLAAASPADSSAPAWPARVRARNAMRLHADSPCARRYEELHRAARSPAIAGNARPRRCRAKGPGQDSAPRMWDLATVVKDEAPPAARVGDTTYAARFESSLPGT